MKVVPIIIILFTSFIVYGQISKSAIAIQWDILKFSATKPAGQGTGLGLSLSYDIIKTIGGKIGVESKEGEGSEFSIQLQTN